MQNSLSSQTQKSAKEASEHPALDAAASIGYVVLGVLYVLIGWISIRIATGSGKQEASNSGALHTIAQAPGGRIAIWVGVVGLMALAVWRIAQAILKSQAKHKVKSGALAVVYLSLAFTAGKIAAGKGASDGQKTSTLTGTVLSQPAGMIAVMLAGAALIGFGLYDIYRGVSRKFAEQLEAGAHHGEVGSAIVIIGVIGHVARGIAFAVLGGLVIWAAKSHDPEKASGLDAALRYIGQQPFGQTLLVIMGVGLMCFGVYTVARARYGDAD